jgi:hypothetical protein
MAKAGLQEWWGRVFAPVAAALLAGCMAEPPARVILPLPPPELRKTEFLRNAAILFKEHNPRVDILFTGLESADGFATLTPFLRRHSLTEVFSPAGSAETMEFARYLARLGLSPEKRIWGQVIASEAVHQELPLRSLFFPAGRYFAGIPGQLQRLNVELEREIVIFQENPHPYTGEIVRALRMELAGAGYRNLRVIEVPEGDIKAVWGSSRLSTRSVLVFAMHGIDRVLPLGGDSAFRTRLRFLSYGRAFTPGFLEPVARPRPGDPPEIHALYWSPFLELGASSSCEFSQAYLRRFSRLPDFHAAFLYASLEAATDRRGGRSRTIVGEVDKGRASGLRQELSPLFLEFQANETVLHGSDFARDRCRNFPAADEYFSLVKWSPGRGIR